VEKEVERMPLFNIYGNTTTKKKGRKKGTIPPLLAETSESTHDN